jgi:putative transposase
MNTYKRHRFPPDIIAYAVWLYYRFNLSHRGFGDTFYIDEVFVKINGKQHYLWRAVDQDGEVVDVFIQAKRDVTAAKRFFRSSTSG